MTAKVIGSKVLDSRLSVKELLSTNNPFFNERMKGIVNKNFENIEQTRILEKKNEPTPNLYYFNANLYNSSMR